MLDGNAELFGTELIKQKRKKLFFPFIFFNEILAYYFNGGKGYGIFTWSSCKVRITGKTESAYISKDTPMVQYVNIAFAIEGLRKQAEARENQVDNQGTALDSRVSRMTL